MAAKTPTQDRCDLSDAFTRLSDLVAPEMEAVNLTIRTRMQSEHAPRIPELSAHLIEAGGKRLRPVLTVAAAKMFGYEGDHQIRRETITRHIAVYQQGTGRQYEQQHRTANYAKNGESSEFTLQQKMICRQVSMQAQCFFHFPFGGWI